MPKDPSIDHPVEILHERRSFDGLDTRPALGDGESRCIEGLAIVYERESEVLYDWWEDRAFTEIVHRGAVTKELLSSSDILALYEHDRTKLLARSTHGEGSLTLSITQEGLRYSFDAPKTQLGDDTLELLRRGDLRASSFLFGVGKGDTRWEQRSDGSWIRHIDHFSFLGDVSVVSQPAYPQSTANARSLPDFPPSEDPKKEPHSKSPFEEYALKRANLISL